MVKRKILFLTGTRADFGKLKPLIRSVHNSDTLDYEIFGTGMHLMAKYGNTISEITKAGFKTPFIFMNQVEGESMEMILANTIKGLSRYLHEHHDIDLIVVHGDRIEALAAATVGALRNVLVAHIEGGEISGTIDELIRHATSKLSHLHFVSSEVAESRLKQLGEEDKTIFRIGSPDVDVMLSSDLPSLNEVKQRYDIEYETFAIGILHPVTTEKDKQVEHSDAFVESLIKSEDNYIIIYPNNDLGSSCIFKAYERLKNMEKVKLFPSLRFEYFLTLMKNAKYIIGNSSTGIHEAPVYGVPTINIGNRQKNRFNHKSILNIDFSIDQILKGIDWANEKVRFKPSNHYGIGNSAEKFIQVLNNKSLWNTSTQKQFKDN